MFGLDLLSAVVRIKADSSAFDASILGLANRVESLGGRMNRAFGPATASLAALSATARAAEKATIAAAGAVGMLTSVGAVGGLVAAGKGLGLLGGALRALPAAAAAAAGGIAALSSAAAGPLRALRASSAAVTAEARSWAVVLKHLNRLIVRGVGDSGRALAGGLRSAFASVAAMARSPMATVRALSEALAGAALSASLLGSFAMSRAMKAPGAIGRGAMGLARGGAGHAARGGRAVAGGMEALGGAAGNLFGDLAQKLESAFAGKGLIGSLGVIGKGIKGVLGSILSAAWSMAKGIGSAIGAAVGSLAELGKSALSLAMAPFKTLGAAVAGLGNVLSALGGVFTSLAGVVGSVVTGVFNALVGVVKGLFDALHGLVGALQSVAAAIDQALITGLKLAAGAAIGVTAAIAATIKVGGDLEQTYISLRRVTGLNADETARLAANLQQIARNSPGATLGQINKIANFAGRLGVGGDTARGKVAGITSLTTALSKLSLALDDFDVESAATQMLRILKVFHRDENASMNFASSLIALDNASTATGQELLHVVQRLSGVGSTLGATIPQMLALGAAMRDSGVEVESGSTAVSNLMARMAADTKKYADAVKLDFRSLASVVATDPVRAVEMFLGALKEFKPEEQTRILASLHMTGRMSGQILLQLAQNMQDVSKFTAIANQEWKSMAALETGVALASKGAWAQLQVLGNRLQLIGAEVGRAVLPAFKALVDVFNYFADRTLSGLQAMGPMFEAWGQKVANSIGYARTAFDEFPSWLTLAWLKFKEWAIKLTEVAARLKPALITLFKEIFAALTTMAANAGKEMGLQIQEAITDALASKLNKAPGWLRPMLETLLGVVGADEADRNRPRRGVAAIMHGVQAPTFDGFSGLFSNLPDLGDRDRKARADAKGKIERRADMIEMPGVAQAVAGRLRAAMGDAFGRARAGAAALSGAPAGPPTAAGARRGTEARRRRRELIRSPRARRERAAGTFRAAAAGAEAAGFPGVAGVAGALAGRLARPAPVGSVVRPAAPADVHAKLLAGDMKGWNKGWNDWWNRTFVKKAEMARDEDVAREGRSEAVRKKMGPGFGEDRRTDAQMAKDAAADRKLAARRKRGSRVPLPQAPSLTFADSEVGKSYGIAEFGQQMFASLLGGKGENDSLEGKIDSAVEALGKDDSGGLRGALAKATTQLVDITTNGVKTRLA